ncbi:MAG: C-GCAxxG-C-C family (seleno)protein [Clostridia bacterium]|nr:C-GCAxxG-C-C family (seleno)protein [Clostridia bacterium]
MKNDAYSYFIEQDYNCAESVVRVANDRFGMQLPEEGMQLLSGFGGGMCCGKACGAICGALAIVSKNVVEGRAHATEGFKDKCAGIVERMENEFGSLNCADIKPKYFKEDTRCLEVVEKASDILEAYMKELSE